MSSKAAFKRLEFFDILVDFSRSIRVRAIFAGKTIMKRKNEMFGHIKAWEISNLSQLDFCNKNGIALGTFGYWQMRYLKKDKAETKVKVFKPIKLVSTTKNNYSTLFWHLYYLTNLGIRV